MRSKRVRVKINNRLVLTVILSAVPIGLCWKGLWRMVAIRVEWIAVILKMAASDPDSPGPVLTLSRV